MSKELHIEKAIDSNLKPVKDSDGTSTALEISTDKTRVKGLEVTGEAKGQTPTVGNGFATKQYVDDNVGGTSYWLQVWTGRQYTRYDNWFFPSTTYSVNSANWNTTFNSPSLPTSWADSYNPQIVVPKACTLTEYTYTGNFQTSQDYEFALMKGTGVTYGSAGNYTLSQVGATQSVSSATANILYEIGQTGLSVSLSKGDMLVPAFRRTTEDTSTYRFLELSFSIVCEIG